MISREGRAIRDSKQIPMEHEELDNWSESDLVSQTLEARDVKGCVVFLGDHFPSMIIFCMVMV